MRSVALCVASMFALSMTVEAADPAVVWKTAQFGNFAQCNGRVTSQTRSPGGEALSILFQDLEIELDTMTKSATCFVQFSVPASRSFQTQQVPIVVHLRGQAAIDTGSRAEVVLRANEEAITRVYEDSELISETFLLPIELPSKSIKDYGGVEGLIYIRVLTVSDAHPAATLSVDSLDIGH